MISLVTICHQHSYYNIIDISPYAVRYILVTCLFYN